MEPRTYTSEYRELVALCQAQSEAITKLEAERDKALVALRDVIGVIEGTQDFRFEYVIREREILAIAKKALEEAQ